MNYKEEFKKILSATLKLEVWLKENNYYGFEPFDGLDSYLSVLTFNNKFLKQSLQQTVKRLPINIRPIIGIKPSRATKAMSFIGIGYLNLSILLKDEEYKANFENCFVWLMENSSKGYSGYCWGNSFNYISRGFYLPKNCPTLVWCSLIGHHFIEAYRHTDKKEYLNVCESIGTFILKDLPIVVTSKGNCISYVPHKQVAVHNANLLGAMFLSELYGLTKDPRYSQLALNSIEYSLNCQMPDGSWFYGEEEKFHWIDNWHTAYNLDSLIRAKIALQSTQFESQINKGFNYYYNNFFQDDGAPKFYSNKVYQYNIQSCSQSIDSLVLYYQQNKDSIYLELAINVANWTIKNMQDNSGFFYLFKNKYFVNKTPTLHWGCATMFHALSNLLLTLNGCI